MKICDEELSSGKYLFRYLRMFNNAGNNHKILSKSSIIQREKKYKESIENFLKNYIVTFSSPKYFNDPFDSKICFSLKKISTDSVMRHFENVKRSLTNANQSGKIRAAEIAEINTLQDIENWKHNLLAEARKFFQPEIDRVGILCLTHEHSDILMWSHYADSHRGFCMIFNKEALKQYIEKINSKKRRYYFQLVDYRDEYLTYDDFLDGLENNQKAIKQTLFRKALHWQYEQEWRLVCIPSHYKFHQELKLPEDVIHGIIFGCKMTNNDKESILRVGGKRQLSLYEAKQKEDEFKIITKIFERTNIG